jgi:hypothetical protein
MQMTDDTRPSSSAAGGPGDPQAAAGGRGLTPRKQLRDATLLGYLAIVAVHGLEHLLQMAQIHLLGWPAHDAGGALGLFLPGLLHSEALHFGYNLFQLAGLVLLRHAFDGVARRWWTVALAAQAWHFFEHVLLQAQYLSGSYLFGAAQQTSIGQLLVPRAELHAVYNLIVVVPIGVAVALRASRAVRGRTPGGAVPHEAA